jgi:hypothetical protein
MSGHELRARGVARILLAVPVLVLASSDATADTTMTTGPRDCVPSNGTFTDVFLSGPVNCPNSPIQLCTKGVITGDLVGTFRLDFVTQTTAGMGGGPVTQFTAADSINITSGGAGAGTLTGTDFGTLRTTKFPTADFTTHITLNSGTGALLGASGLFTIQGSVNLLTGIGSGTYVATICTPR